MTCGGAVRMGQNFLMLQGTASPFFSRVGDWLICRGAGGRRVNFCTGDAVYWWGKAAGRYRGAPDGFADFLAQKCESESITDLILFADQRPFHQVAVSLARSTGRRLHTFEEGYIRPNYITLERGLSNAPSALPRDPD